MKEGFFRELSWEGGVQPPEMFWISEK